jgi:hypothetical protein
MKIMDKTTTRSTMRIDVRIYIYIYITLAPRFLTERGGKTKSKTKVGERTHTTRLRQKKRKTGRKERIYFLLSGSSSSFIYEEVVTHMARGMAVTGRAASACKRRAARQHISCHCTMISGRVTTLQKKKRLRCPLQLSSALVPRDFLSLISAVEYCLICTTRLPLSLPFLLMLMLLLSFSPFILFFGLFA